MADETIRKRYGVDEILRRIPDDRGEFFVEFLPWPDDLSGWRRSARERFVEAGNRVLLRTIWDNIEDRDSRILIDVVECDSAADAVEALADRLENNQLAEIPEGPREIGLASFQHPGFAPPVVLYVHGNLAITVASFGRKPVEVSDLAGRLDRRVGERPNRTNNLMWSVPLLEAAPSARTGEEILLRLNMPARNIEDSYLKLFATGGTIARRAGQLVTRAETAGKIEIEAFLVEPIHEAFAATSTIIIR